MSLAKIPFLVSVIWGNHVSLTPPNPPPPRDERVGEPTMIGAVFARYARQLPFIRKIMMGAACMCEIAVILCHRYPTSELSKRLLSHLILGAQSESSRLQAAGRIHPTRLFYVGWLLTCLGGLIRIACYRSLGRLFTYELAIRPGHQLMTSGPYSVVRHPSYIGSILVGFGVAMSCGSQGSWMQESGLWETWAGKILALTYLLLFGNSALNFVLRTTNEDAFLKKEFGQRWDEWARRVPYKLLPGIF